MHIEQFSGIISEYAAKQIPFVFIVDFDCAKPIVAKLSDAAGEGLFYDIMGISNIKSIRSQPNIYLQSFPIDKMIYEKQFQKVQSHINNGDSYLLNLTFPTEILINITLDEIFHTAQAPYKLLFKDEFVVFSPECFIRTRNNKIFTYPMKGTIDANIDNAENILLSNDKEKWEHNTIVDLMRNDLALIANNIQVSKYRYVEKIITNNSQILQTSSEISGDLPEDWRNNIGENIVKLLPAGSISGAPKKKTVEIIKNLEVDNRGYYSGIFGIFDGENIHSAVSIRYIEKNNNKFIYRSGGGITALSDMKQEYEELIHKIYVPSF